MSDAFGMQVYETVQSLRGIALRYVGSDGADDLMQDTIVNALRHRNSFQPGSNLAAWLTTIMRNKRLTQIRRDKFVGVYDPETAERVEDPTAHRIADARIDLRKRWNSVPREARALLFDLTVNEMTYKEAGRKYNLPTGTVKSRLHRIRIGEYRGGTQHCRVSRRPNRARHVAN